MGETETNLILRLLREIRGDTADTRQRVTKIERRFEELQEGVVTALGLAGLANVSTEKHGEGIDELRDELESRRRRVSDLEARA